MKHKLMMTMIVSALFCGCFTGCGEVAETEKYIVENQEYVYSTYGDIGQLGEDGNYYNSDYPGKDAYEVPIFETTADLTHDGIADLVSVVGYGSEPDEAVDDVISNSSYGCYVKVYRGTKDGEYESHPRFISRNFHLSHAGNGTICLSKKDGLDYLLISMTYEMQGTAQYDFAAFYVDDEKGIVIEDTYGVEFAVDRMNTRTGTNVHTGKMSSRFCRKK